MTDRFKDVGGVNLLLAFDVGLAVGALVAAWEAGTSGEILQVLALAGVGSIAIGVALGAVAFWNPGDLMGVEDR